MKRDMDLIRTILLEVEAAAPQPGWIDLEIVGYDPAVISEHVQLLADEGLIEAKDLSAHDGFEFRPTRLTWKGHAFLDAARDETVWERTKARATAKGGRLRLAGFQQLLIEVGTASPMPAKKLTGEQVKRLTKLLTDAFSDRGQLKMLVRVGLSENLDEIAGGGNLRETAFHLIEWAESHGRIAELIAAAIEERPNHTGWQEFAEEYRKWVSAPETAPETTGSQSPVQIQPTSVPLNDEEHTLLIHSLGREGSIARYRTDYGFCISTWGLQVGGTEGQATIAASYEDALRSLVQRGYVRLEQQDPRGGEAYRLTGAGFKIAEELAARVRATFKKELRQEERELLRSSAATGEIRYLTSNESVWIRAGQDHYGDRNDRTVGMRYKAALDKLCKRGFVRHSKGMLYELTYEGIQLAKDLASETASVREQGMRTLQGTLSHQGQAIAEDIEVTLTRDVTGPGLKDWAGKFTLPSTTSLPSHGSYQLELSDGRVGRIILTKMQQTNAGPKEYTFELASA
jgi:hypothetical protein